MSDLLLRNIPEDLKRDIESRAKKSGRSLSEEAKLMLARAIEVERPRQGFGTMMREVFASFDISQAEHEKVWGDIERSRKSDASRPLPYSD